MTERFQIPKVATYHLQYNIDGGEWVDMGVHEIPIDELGTPTRNAFYNIRMSWETNGTTTPIVPQWILYWTPQE